MHARCFTVGPLQENCWIVHGDGSETALVIDPGEEADRLIAAIDDLSLTVEAILLTHTHFDHVGAVAPLARAHGRARLLPGARGRDPAGHQRVRLPGVSGRSSRTTPRRRSRAAIT